MSEIRVDSELNLISAAYSTSPEKELNLVSAAYSTSSEKELNLVSAAYNTSPTGVPTFFDHACS